jgi:hypothetical protein
LTYCEDIADDRREHAQRHRRRSAAAKALGYLPATYHAQETSKREGWSRITHGTTLEERLAGAEIVLRAWFDRSLEAAIRCGYWKQHPTFERFAGMMTGEVWDADLLAAVRAKYGDAQVDEIAPGASYWFPPGSRDRALQWTESRRWAREKEAPSS